jgi:DNA-binding CsgD family transcriptional regulator
MLTILTPAQQRVARLIVAGKINKVIAHELGIAESTVKVHVCAIMERMKVGRRAEIVAVILTARIAELEAENARLRACHVPDELAPIASVTVQFNG